MAICPIVLPFNPYGFGWVRSVPPGDEWIQVIYKSLDGKFVVQLENQAKKMEPEITFNGKKYKADVWREPGDEWQKYVERRYYSRLLRKPFTKKL